MAAPLPTRDDFFQVGARELLARQLKRPPGKRVTAAAIFTTGTNVNSALAGAAAMSDEVMRHTAIRFNELFLDSSDDVALARLVTDHIDAELFQKQPARAVVPLVFNRAIPPSSGGVSSVGADQIVRTTTGVEFRVVTPVTFAVGATSSITVAGESMLAGSAGNVDAGTIVQFAQAPADPGITVTNLEFASGGGDLETSRDYLARAKLARKANRRGTTEAILLGALSVLGVKSAVVEEVLDGSGDPNGLIRVYIADANGRANSVLVQMVREGLVTYRACGVIPQVLGTLPTYVNIAYSAQILPGYSATIAADQLRSLTVAMVNLLSPGETLQRSMLIAIARTVAGLVVTEGSVVTPATDLVPLPTQTLKTRTDLALVNGA